jgi:hypothetical protein
MEYSQIAIWCFAVYLVLALTYSFYRSWKIKNWPYVIAKLIHADVYYLNAIEIGSASANVKYEYKVEGKKYVGTRLSPLAVRGQVGPKIKKQLAKIQYVSEDQVKVFYSVKNPRKSYLVKESWINIFG